MENGKIMEKNGYHYILYKKDSREFQIKMKSYQIPFFSIGEHVIVNTRTGYCLRYEQKSPIRYGLS